MNQILLGLALGIGAANTLMLIRLGRRLLDTEKMALMTSGIVLHSKGTQLLAEQLFEFKAEPDDD